MAVLLLFFLNFFDDVNGIRQTCDVVTCVMHHRKRI